MIFALMLLLALLLMTPLFFSFYSKSDLRERRESSLALHRAQLAELERDLTLSRIERGEYAAARLEIERRLLAADRLDDGKPGGNARFLLAAVAILIPVMGFLLYLPGSTPLIPSEPHAEWLARRQAAHAQAEALIAALRAKLKTLDPDSVEASQGQAYLAEALAEDAGQLTPESIALFKQSLVHTPANASWRSLDVQRLNEAQADAASQ